MIILKEYGKELRERIEKIAEKVEKRGLIKKVNEKGFFNLDFDTSKIDEIEEILNKTNI